MFERCAIDCEKRPAVCSLTDGTHIFQGIVQFWSLTQELALPAEVTGGEEAVDADSLRSLSEWAA